MLKVLGSIFIFFGAVGLGGNLSRYLNSHLMQLQECREILAQTDVGREYFRLPYAQLLKRTAKGKTKIFQDILQKIAGEMEKNNEADVGVLWDRTFEENKDKILLTTEEKEIVIGLAKSLSLEGNHEKVCKMYFQRLDERIVHAIEEKKEKQKLYRTISVLAGIFIVVILL